MNSRILLVNPFLIAAALLLSALTVFVIPITWLPYWLVALGVVTGLVAYAVLGNPLIPLMVWFFTAGCLHDQFYRLIVTGFFNLTVPRVLIVLLVAVFAIMFAVGRLRFRWAWPTSALLLILLAYFTVSAAIAGFETKAVTASVHYRLIQGYWFPVIMFFLMLQAVRTDADIPRVLTFFMLFGLYLTFTCWMEHFKVWSLVWPEFISDPEKGIHWGRARGPFLGSPTLGVVMIYIFFNNLVLARTNGPLFSFFCRCAAVAALPVIFWTQTRSVWLAMLLASLLWIIASRRGITRTALVSLILAAGIGAAAYNWSNITSKRREAGGVAVVEPIYVRLGLALITWEMFKDRPIVGVGFGHFRDYTTKYSWDPSSPFYAFASSMPMHSNFLSILAECGLVGLILYVWILVAFLRVSLRVYRRLPAFGSELIGRDLIVLYWILYVDYFVTIMFVETTLGPFDNSLFFGLTGMIYALDHMLGPVPIGPTPGEEAERSPLRTAAAAAGS